MLHFEPFRGSGCEWRVIIDARDYTRLFLIRGAMIAYRNFTQCFLHTIAACPITTSFQSYVQMF